MSPLKLVRLGGLALVLSGVLFVIANLVGVYLNLDPRAPLIVLIFGAAIALIAAPFGSLGLISLYARRPEATGIFGLAAFLIAFCGAVLITGLYWFNTFIAPSVALLSLRLFQRLQIDPPGPLAFGLSLSYLLFFLGWMLFGVAVLRAQLYPRPVLILLIISSLLCGVLNALNELIGGPSNAGGILPYVSAVVYMIFSAIIAWLGFVIWTGRGVPEETSA